MLPYFKIFSSFFMFKSALKVKKNAKIVILGFVFALVGCSFQQSAPRRFITTTSEASTIEQANKVEFINLSATNGGDKPVVSNLVQVAYPCVEKLSLRGHVLQEADFEMIEHVGKKLFYLDLAACGLQTIPKEIASAGNLTTLYLSDNRICGLTNSVGGLDPSFYSLKKLTYINLDRNQIEALPEGFSGVESLIWLRLNNNNLSTLPSDFRLLKNIKRLYLNGNKFTEVPEVIRHMTSLEELSLGNNQITEFPEWLCDMPNLTRIDLYGNPIKDIPDRVVEMPKLTTLVMDNCDLEYDRKQELNQRFADKRIKFIF